MKTRLNGSTVLALGLAGGLILSAPHVRADVGVSVGVQINAVADFHAPLASHGVWVEAGSYGRCWRPAHVTVGWRPYCDGYWVWTDCGWYWVSDEPWAWACYHYGTWVHDPFHGWIWVPEIEWAPAWVHWRVGGGHIGWAPCGPRGVVIAPSAFVFVGTQHFHKRVRPSTVIVNNSTIINNTTRITDIRRETRNIAGRPQKVVVNEGPGIAAVQKATGRTIEAVSVREVDRQTPIPAGMKRRMNDSAGKPTPAEGAASPDKTLNGAPPDRVSPPGRSQESSSDEVQPAPNQKRSSEPSSGKQPGPSKGKKGSGQNKDSGKP